MRKKTHNNRTTASILIALAQMLNIAVASKYNYHKIGEQTNYLRPNEMAKGAETTKQYRERPHLATMPRITARLDYMRRKAHLHAVPGTQILKVQ